MINLCYLCSRTEQKVYFNEKERAELNAEALKEAEGNENGLQTHPCGTPSFFRSKMDYIFLMNVH